MSVSVARGSSPLRARLSTRGTGLPGPGFLLLFIATCSWGLSGTVVSAEAGVASVPDEVSVRDRSGESMVWAILNGIFAELVWISVGGAVGCLGVFRRIIPQSQQTSPAGSCGHSLLVYWHMSRMRLDLRHRR